MPAEAPVPDIFAESIEQHLRALEQYGVTPQERTLHTQSIREALAHERRRRAQLEAAGGLEFTAILVEVGPVRSDLVPAHGSNTSVLTLHCDDQAARAAATLLYSRRVFTARVP